MVAQKAGNSRPSANITVAITGLFLFVQSASAQAADSFLGIPNVTFKYYDVIGNDIPAIQASVHAQGPVDSNDGSHGYAHTQWNMRWHWEMGPAGCQGTVDFSVEVTLPRLADERAVAPAVLGKWNSFIQKLLGHEAGHARYAFEKVAEVQKALEAPTCADVDARARSVLAQIHQHDSDYDRQTSHGKSEGAVFP